MVDVNELARLTAERRNDGGRAAIRSLSRELRRVADGDACAFDGEVSSWQKGSDVVGVRRHFERKGFRVTARQAGPNPHGYGPMSSVLIKVSWDHKVGVGDVVDRIMSTIDAGDQP